MLRPDGYVKVLDFGIAKLAEQEVPATMAEEEALLLVETNLGSILGTVRYMSPEQARGAPIDKRTDIWSLGAVLYEMATGHAPFAGETPREVMDAILAGEPLPLSNYMVQAPGELQQIVSKALRKEPDQRYQNAKEMLEALKGLRHKLEFTAELERAVAVPLWLRWARWAAALALTLLAGALAVALFYWLRNPSISSIPEKSIAVLPFENLSNDKGDASFADGLQDDVLTKLAKIADLKVISRTSVMQYRGKQNTREIGNALRVSHVLEGSARKTGSWFHINAQLIDTRTDTHVWAEEYDRDLNDVFAIQSEIAQKVAEQLHAKMSASEKLAIESKPTADLTAFDLYTRAKNILLEKAIQTKAELLEAIDLLNQASARDPSFIDAYCQLAYVHDWLYFGGYDHTPARLALAEAAIQAAARLNPNAGETHLARAQNLYWGYLDYNGALAELEIARQTLPNDFRVPLLMATIQRRRGQWEESTRSYEHAVELNPRNIETRMGIAINYMFLRRYADVRSALASALAVFPNDLDTRVWPAYVEFQEKADTRPLHQMLDSIRATNPTPTLAIAKFWLACALAERDAAAAKNPLDAYSENSNLWGELLFSRSLLEGILARMTKDEGKARSAFVAARA